jgi:hypothetical protein
MKIWLIGECQIKHKKKYNLKGENMDIKKTMSLVIIVLFSLWLPGSMGAEDTNHFCGEGAGASITTGLNETFLGDMAGYNTTSGLSNTFVGYLAGYSNTTGQYNMFSGYSAGYSNTTGSYNTFYGFRAGHCNTTANANTFIGNDAGHYNTTGANNTFVGLRAGRSNTTGRTNIFLGYETGYFNTAGNRNIFLGQHAGKSNISGCDDIYIGFEAGKLNETGSRNIFIGTTAGNNNAGSDNIFIGYQAGYLETGSQKLYIANGKYPSDTLIYGDFSSDRVGIGTTSPEYELEVDGTVCADDYVTNCDLRLKKDVEPIEKALERIARLRGVTFHWKDGKKDKGQQLGVIAQEIEDVFPQVVYTDGKGYKSVDYSNLVAPLIEAVKELKAENETLKQRLEAVEKKLKN